MSEGCEWVEMFTDEKEYSVTTEVYFYASQIQISPRWVLSDN